MGAQESLRSMGGGQLDEHCTSRELVLLCPCISCLRVGGSGRNFWIFFLKGQDSLDFRWAMVLKLFFSLRTLLGVVSWGRNELSWEVGVGGLVVTWGVWAFVCWPFCDMDDGFAQYLDGFL